MSCKVTTEWNQWPPSRLHVRLSRWQLAKFQRLYMNFWTTYCNATTRTGALRSDQPFLTSLNRYYWILYAETWLARIWTGKSLPISALAIIPAMTVANYSKPTVILLFNGTDCWDHSTQSGRSYRHRTHHHQGRGADNCSNTRPTCKNATSNTVSQPISWTQGTALLGTSKTRMISPTFVPQSTTLILKVVIDVKEMLETFIFAR